MRLKWILGGATIALAVVIATTLSFDSNIVYFYLPSEVSAQKETLQGKTIKVGAMVKKDTVVWEPKTLDLAFVITDYEGHEFKVTHKGVKPDMFKEGQGVVVEGRLSGEGEIIARTLMVKHSEEYRKPEATHSVDKELLEKSIFGDRGG